MIFFRRAWIISVSISMLSLGSASATEKYTAYLFAYFTGNGIKSALSDKLTEGYVLYDKYPQVTSAAVEGSCVFKLIDSDVYVLMYDMYTSGSYQFAISTDLKNFKADPTPISFDFTPRHGTVIPITETEKLALYARWNPTGILSDARKDAPTFSVFPTKNGIILTKGKSLRGLTVSVTDVSGREVCRGIVPGGEARVLFPGLSTGVYQVTCTTDGRCLGAVRIVVR